MLRKHRIINSDRYCGRNPTGASRPIAADAFDESFDAIGNRLQLQRRWRQPKLHRQRAEPIPHRRGQDPHPRRRRQSHDAGREGD